MVFGKKVYEWEFKSLCMYPVMSKDRQPVTARKIALQWYQCSTLAGHVLSNSCCLAVLKAVLKFHKKFVTGYMGSENRGYVK